MPSSASSSKAAPRVLFFGMQGNFSAPSLVTLLENGITVCAVVVPAAPLPGAHPPAIQPRTPARMRHAVLPLVRSGLPPDLLQVAAAHQIPVWETSQLAHPETVQTLAAYHADCICVACFSQRIPRVIRALPRLGCLNVHPSLLPANRGPVPLFWVFREGLTLTGVTIHEVEEKMDSGAILAQETLPVPDGISYERLEIHCAELGGHLLARTVWEVYEGRATRLPQDEARSSYHSFPTADDLVVDASCWEARHLYNFIHGVRNWDFPILLHAAGQQLLVHDALSFGSKDLPQESGALQIACRNGYCSILASPIT